MSDKATSGNADVVAEPTMTVGTGEATTFDEIDSVMTHEPAPKEKAEPKASKEAKAPKESRDKPAKEAKAKPTKVEDAEAPEDAEEPEDGGEEAEAAAPKGKILKLKSGDKEIELSTDTPIKVSVAGKKEDVPLQELIDSYSGKVNYDRKFSEMDKERRTFYEERESLTSVANTLVEKVSKNHEAAFDFAAELVGKDPVEMKMQILQEQIHSLAPYFQMTEDQRKQFLENKKLEWREQKLTRSEALAKEKDDAKAQEAETAKVLSRYGISDDAYADTKQKAKDYLKREPTSAEVVEAHRTMMLSDLIRETAPHLKTHPKIETVFDNIIEYATKHPEYSRDDMAADLQAVFGEDKGRLKNIARKVEKSTQAGDTVRPARKSSSSEPLFFDDL